MDTLVETPWGEDSEDEEIVEKCLDDLTLTAEVRFNNLIDFVHNEYANKY